MKHRGEVTANNNESRVSRIRLSADKYAQFVAIAKQEKRKLTNLAQVMIEEGIERRA